VGADKRYGRFSVENNITARNGIHYIITMPTNITIDKSELKEYEKLNLSSDEIKSRFSIGTDSETRGSYYDLTNLSIVLPARWRMDTSPKFKYNFLDDKGKNRG
jgi:hypothetical protein